MLEQQPTPERALPFSIESEQIVLGTLIAQPETLIEAIGTLKVTDFYRKSHQTIYAAICMMYNKLGNPPDFIALSDFLEKKKRLESIGGSPYLMDITVYSTGFSTFIYHVEQVQKKAVFRQLAAAAAEIVAMAFEQRDDALVESERLLYQISQDRAVVDLVSGSEVMANYMARLETRNLQAKHGQPIGLSTGFADLDALLGGLQPQELYILGGRPGEGKTSLLLNIMLNMIERYQSRIAVFSMEMSDMDLAGRLVSMKAGIDSQLLRTRSLTDDECARVVNAADDIASDSWFVDESGKLSIGAIAHKCRRHKTQHGLDLVIVDYLQLMEGNEQAGKRQYNRVQEVGEISRGLKQLAKDLDVPVFAAASLSRASEQRQSKRPQLSDLRESGSIESDADVVLFISRCRDEGMQGLSIIDIAKHRNGPIGEVTLRFEAAYTRFCDLDSVSQAYPPSEEWEESIDE